MGEIKRENERGRSTRENRPQVSWLFHIREVSDKLGQGGEGSGKKGTQGGGERRGEEGEEQEGREGRDKKGKVRRGKEGKVRGGMKRTN